MGIRAILVALVLAVGGCSVVSQVGDWVNENPLAADLVVRQTVHRVIDSAEDPAARAVRVLEVIEAAERYLDGTPVATVDDLLAAIEAAIRWDRISVADAVLIRDLMYILTSDLALEVDTGGLDAEAELGVRSLLRTAANAARYYSAN